MRKLSKKFVDHVKDPGFYGDGDGLYLSVKKTGSKSWILRTMVKGKRRDIGLGSVKTVTLSEAREKSRELRNIARAGKDPTQIRNRRDLTFEEAAREYHAIVSASFSSPKHAKLWLSGLRIHAFPKIGGRELATISTTEVRLILEPLWQDRHETARKLKQRIEAIFDWAKAEGHFAGDNPCAGIKRILKHYRRMPQHHAALAWRDVPTFYSELCERSGTSALALRFLILTACRSREVREANWSEVSQDIWIIPSARTKTRKPHRVPLAEEATRVLDLAAGLNAEFVFPSTVYKTRCVQPLSVNAFRPLYQRMQRDGFTTHGFRSSFRDWCCEEANANREVAEAALAHSLGQVERAYRRSDLFEQRRHLMNSWAQFVSSKA